MWRYWLKIQGGVGSDYRCCKVKVGVIAVCGKALYTQLWQRGKRATWRITQCNVPIGVDCCIPQATTSNQNCHIDKLGWMDNYIMRHITAYHHSVNALNVVRLKTHVMQLQRRTARMPHFCNLCWQRLRRGCSAAKIPVELVSCTSHHCCDC